MFRVPIKVKNNAATALEMKKLGYHGMTDTGIQRSRQLCTKMFVSEKDIKNMRAWFARHIKTSYPGYIKWVNDGKPMFRPDTYEEKNKYRGAVAWLGWGGDEAMSWVNGI